jgi:membrane protease subunit (stomatin/prohibitin family)
MSLWERLTGEFIDVIEWTDDSRNTIVWRYERRDAAIKYGAKLTVREGQTAVFINEGQLADIFPPGMYMLETRNLPILSTLQAWDHGFQSPFKADVYFVNTRRFTDLKWGTKNPIMLRDPEFGPVRLRAFGTYTMRVVDPGVFLREIVGTDGHFTTDEITEQLRNIVVTKASQILASSGIPVLDLAANKQKLGEFVTNLVAPEVKPYGIELAQLLVENVSLPPEVEAALDKRSSMGVIGDLGKYTQFQAAEALGKGAGGALDAGIGLGAGMSMAQRVAEAMAGTRSPAAPPPLPATGPTYWVAIGGQQQGPFDAEALAGLVKDGKLGPASLVWAEGMAGWAKAAERADLQAILSAAPPPLPPAA